MDLTLSLILFFRNLFGSQPLVDFTAPFCCRGLVGFAESSLLRSLTSGWGEEIAGEGIRLVPDERVSLVCEEHFYQAPLGTSGSTVEKLSRGSERGKQYAESSNSLIKGRCIRTKVAEWMDARGLQLAKDVGSY